MRGPKACQDAQDAPATSTQRVRLEVVPGQTLEEWVEAFTDEMEEREQALEERRQRRWTTLRSVGLEVR